jgi:integrase
VPRLSRSYPRYAFHKPSGQARVQLGGRSFYLGPHGSPESRAAYDRLVAEWLANGRRPPGPGPARDAPGDGLTVNEVIVRYMEFARAYYRKSGKETREVRNVKDSLRPLRALYGDHPAVNFGPRALKAVRARMIADGLSRGVVNQRIGRIVRAFKWAGSEEFVPSSVYQSLRTVDGIRRDGSAARETEPVKPVPEAFVDAVRPHVSAQVWAMIELQRLSAMRPDEVVTMRTADLDTSGPIWAYRPASHKMEHKGRGRIVFLGPRAQAILRPWFRPSLEEYLFQPREASAARRAAMRAARKTPVQPSQRDRSRPGARRRPGLRYTVATYRAAIYAGPTEPTGPLTARCPASARAAVHGRNLPGRDLPGVQGGRRPDVEPQSPPPQRRDPSPPGVRPGHGPSRPRSCLRRSHPGLCGIGPPKGVRRDGQNRLISAYRDGGG